MSVLNDSVLKVFKAIQSLVDDDLPSPATCQKRASVALILAFFPLPASKECVSERFDELGTLRKHVANSNDVPHVLFIRRAARSSDRWSSHVALPGGRREPNETDLDAAIRETMEEVSLDISPRAAFCAGSLGQRLVTSRLGTLQLLTLCPYLFLLKDVGRAPHLTGQASEVHGCHWVPLSDLLDPSNATKEYVDVSSRLIGGEKSMHPQASRMMQKVVRLATGLLSFSGIALKPSLSIYSAQDNSVPGTGQIKNTTLELSNQRSTRDDSKGEKMILWGLTQAVLLDFLDMFPNSTVRNNWQYPTFTSPDLAFVLYLLNTRHRSIHSEKRHNYASGDHQDSSRLAFDWVGTAMEGYYSIIRRGIVVTMLARIAFLTWLFKKVVYKIKNI